MSENIQHRTFNEKHVRQNFAEVSGFYDFWAKATESEAARQVLEWAGISGRESVLEAGVGTGLLFERLLRKNSGGFTAGIDLSPEMLEKAEERVSKSRERTNFSLQKASVYELPFAEDTFDCLVSCYVLDLLPEKDFTGILVEFERVLKPGGRLVLASMSPGWKRIHAFWGWMARTFPTLMTDCRPVDLKPFVEEAGFSIEQREKISQNTFPSEVFLARKG